MIFPFVIMAVFVLLIAGLIVFQFIQAQRRREALVAWADGEGWTYAEKDRQLHRRYGAIHPFTTGGSRHSRHVLRGEVDGATCIIHQYQYTVQAGKSSHTHYIRCAALEMPLDGHGLDIQPEHLGHKIVDALGGEDIDFASDAFSRAFWVKCPDRRFAYDILHPDMQEWLMGRRVRWQWHGRILLRTENGRLDPRSVEAARDALAGFRERLPRHLLAEASKASSQVGPA